MDGEKPEGGRVSRLPGSPHRSEGRGSGRSMQKSLERRRERESRHGGDGGTEKKENLVPDHRTGHTETHFHENTGGTALPMGNPPQLDRRLGAEVLFLGSHGGWDVIFLEKELDVF